MSNKTDDKKPASPVGEALLLKRLCYAVETSVHIHHAKFHVCGDCGCRLVPQDATACPVCGGAPTATLKGHSLMPKEGAPEPE